MRSRKTPDGRRRNTIDPHETGLPVPPIPAGLAPALKLPKEPRMRTRRPYRMLLGAALVASIVAGAAGPAAGAAKPAGKSLTKAQIEKDVLGAMDTNADPCQDFYR